MTEPSNRRRLRLHGIPFALAVAATPLIACAEIEVGAEVAKRIARADDGAAVASSVLDPSATATQSQSRPVVLAQASTGGDSLAISPFLEPAPEIFEATGLAIWDGKRTLQGIWVAHPLATSARRVRIFNQNNGQAVDGALFKRDTADGGASVLISSEAAQLLAMDVGTPAELRIVAVSPVQRSTEPQPADQTATVEQSETSEQSDTAEQPATPTVTETAETTQTEPTTPSVQVTATPAPVPAEKPAAQVPQVQPVQQVEPEAEPEVETTIARAEPAQTTKPAQPARTSQLKLPYVQAGIFGVQENATKLIQRIKKQDLPAEGRTLRSKGRTLTRVLAGPFQTVAERDAALRAIRRMGLKDAAPVRR